METSVLKSIIDVSLFGKIPFSQEKYKIRILACIFNLMNAILIN